MDNFMIYIFTFFVGAIYRKVDTQNMVVHLNVDSELLIA